MVRVKIVGGVLVILALLVFAVTYQKPLSSENGSVELTGLMVAQKVTRYPMMAEVIEPDNTSLGLAAEEKFNFGRSPQGSTVKKVFVINSGEEGPVKVRMRPEGDIAPFISFSRNNFLLEGSGDVEVAFHAEETGSFDGTLEVAVVKPNNWLSRWLLEWM